MSVFIMVAFNLAGRPAQADTASGWVRSIDWMVDSSEIIFAGHREKEGVRVDALLKTTPQHQSEFQTGKLIEIAHKDEHRKTSFRDYGGRVEPGEAELEETSLYFFRLTTKNEPLWVKRISLERPIELQLYPGERYFFAVDRRGKPILSGEATLAAVTSRVEHGSVIPLTLNREFAEESALRFPLAEKAFGAKWVPCRSLDLGDWAFNLCVPVSQPFAAPGQGQTPREWMVGGSKLPLLDTMPTGDDRNLKLRLAASKKSGPHVVLPVYPVAAPPQEPEQSRDTAADGVMRIDCDGVIHQGYPRDFSNWAEQMRASRVKRVTIAMPYNPLANEGVELWRLAKWSELRELDLREFHGRNVLRTGRNSWTTAGAQREFPFLERLWLPYGTALDPKFYPKLRTVLNDARDKEGITRTQTALAQVSSNEAKIEQLNYEWRDGFASRPKLARAMPSAETLETIESLSIDGVQLGAEAGEEVWEVLSSAAHLRTLHVVRSEELKRLEQLGTLTALHELAVVDCSQLEDLTLPGGLAELRELRVVECEAEFSEATLVSFDRLEAVALNWCSGLSDLTPVESWQRVKRLELVGTRASDFGPLAGMHQLQELVLDRANNLDDLSFAYGLTHLKRIVLTNCPQLSLTEIRKLQTRLPECCVHFSFHPQAGLDD